MIGVSFVKLLNCLNIIFASLLKLKNNNNKMKAVGSPSIILFLYGIIVKNAFGFEWSESTEFGREAVPDDTSDPEM